MYVLYILCSSYVLKLVNISINYVDVGNIWV